jgi:hypothetical protein
MRPNLCTVCGQGVTLPHKEWCERVRASLARDTTTWCAVPGCNKVVERIGVYCHLHGLAVAS